MLHTILVFSLVAYMPAFIFCFIGIIAETRNTWFAENGALNTGNNLSASNTSIQYFCTVCNIFRVILKISYNKQQKCDNTYLQQNCVNFGTHLDAEILIWMQSRYDRSNCSFTLYFSLFTVNVSPIWCQIRINCLHMLLSYQIESQY